MSVTKQKFTVEFTVNTSVMKKEPQFADKSHAQLALIAYHSIMLEASMHKEVVAMTPIKVKGEFIRNVARRTS